MSVHDLEFEDALPMLSVPHEAHDGFALDRRRFLQGAIGLAAATALPLVRPDRASAATPIAPDDGVLVLVFLGGGNDGLNTLAPISGPARGSYEQLRGGLAIPAGQLLKVDGEWGLNPSLPRLHQRFRRGQVALVQGSGLPVPDLSHFTAAAQMMQGGTAGGGTGWLGRFLDGVTEAESGMRGMTIGSNVPLYLVGRKAKVTAVPDNGSMWGANRVPRGEAALIDAVKLYAQQPSGLGQWGDRIAQSTSASVDAAGTVSKVFQPAITATGLNHDLILAARLLNANLGARVIGVTLGGWDTHIGQRGVHDGLLQELDVAIDTFFANLSSRVRDRVTVLVQSEFGRRPGSNISFGTDHGTAGLQMLIGSGVRGGRHGAAPALDKLDDRGNVTPTVDFRAVYSQVLTRWLRADAKQVLGAPFSGLDLFAASPHVAA